MSVSMVSVSMVSVSMPTIVDFSRLLHAAHRDIKHGLGHAGHLAHAVLGGVFRSIYDGISIVPVCAYLYKSF